jgi:hypothetical protein
MYRSDAAASETSWEGQLSEHSCLLDSSNEWGTESQAYTIGYTGRSIRWVESRSSKSLNALAEWLRQLTLMICAESSLAVPLLDKATTDKICQVEPEQLIGFMLVLPPTMLCRCSRSKG